MAPYFAHLVKTNGPFLGYATTVIFFWLLACMSNIQSMLENPFLTYGRITAEDDICLDQLRSINTISRKERKTRKRRLARWSESSDSLWTVYSENEGDA